MPLHTEYVMRYKGVGSVSVLEGGGPREHNVRSIHSSRPLLFRHSFTRHAHAKRPANERRSLNFNEVPARRS